MSSKKVWWLSFALICGQIGVGDYASGAEARKVKINWREVQDASEYDFEVSKTPEMDPLLDRHTYKDTTVQLKLPPGTYYFRVRGLDKTESPGPWSEVQGFVVNAAGPEMASPDDGEIFEKKLPDKGIEFKWKSGARGSKYVIEFLDGKDAVYKINVKGTDIYWRPPHPGDFTWRVGFETPSGEEWGKLRKITVKREALFDPPPKPITIIKTIHDAPVSTAPESPFGTDPDNNQARPSEWSLIGRLAQAVVAYSATDQDTGLASSGAALVGVYNAELRYRARKLLNQKWTWSGAVNFELIKQSVLDTDFTLPRFFGRVFYGKESGNWRYGPFLQLGAGKAGIFVVQSSASARQATVSRTNFGLGGFASYRAAPNFLLSGLLLLRMDSGGDAPNAIPNPLSNSIGFEGGFGVGVNLNTKLSLEARLRAIQETYAWQPAKVGLPNSSLTDLFIILDVGLGYRF